MLRLARPSAIVRNGMLLRSRVSPRGAIMVPVLLSPGLSAPILRHYSLPFPINHKESKKDKDIQNLPKWKQWAHYFQSEKFQKSMTMYYVCAFGALCVIFYFYMRDRYHEDKQIDFVRNKYAKDPKSLTEYQYLVMKKFSQEQLRPLEEKKFRIYGMMRKEFRRKNLLNTEVMFDPSPEELDEWYAKQPKMSVKKAPVLERDEVEKSEIAPLQVVNTENLSIMPPEDTTEFYELKAQDYDNEIKWEERGMFMGRRRKWLMNQLKGDVLEVACGTGRNLKYLYPGNINSITFLDSSRNMVDITQKKFRDLYPDFLKAAFTVGKAEDLVNLTEGAAIRYDTIVETFGLCSHEDPVKALKNMKELLKPGGRIVLLEHGRSTWDMVNNHLDFRSERRMKTWACRWNLDIGELVDEAGLDITYEKRVHLGTTWMLVCKRPEDPITLDEKPFLHKLFGITPKKVEK